MEKAEGKSVTTLEGFEDSERERLAELERAKREFFGVGAANIGAGLVGGFPVNGSQSRSFVVSDAGSKSQVANLWAALLVLLTLLVLGPVFAYLPAATLAGVVIVAGAGLLAPAEFVALWRYRRIEFWMAVFTICAVLVIGMLGGMTTPRPPEEEVTAPA